VLLKQGMRKVRGPYGLCVFGQQRSFKMQACPECMIRTLKGESAPHLFVQYAEKNHLGTAASCDGRTQPFLLSRVRSAYHVIGQKEEDDIVRNLDVVVRRVLTAGYDQRFFDTNQGHEMDKAVHGWGRVMFRLTNPGNFLQGERPASGTGIIEPLRFEIKPALKSPDTLKLFSENA
jgi:hypothetical protein